METRSSKEPQRNTSSAQKAAVPKKLTGREVEEELVAAVERVRWLPGTPIREKGPRFAPGIWKALAAEPRWAAVTLNQVRRALTRANQRLPTDDIRHKQNARKRCMPPNCHVSKSCAPCVPDCVRDGCAARRTGWVRSEQRRLKGWEERDPSTGIPVQLLLRIEQLRAAEHEPSGPSSS